MIFHSKENYMENILTLSTTLKKLKVPYDKKFYNIPFCQYESLTETIGVPKVQSLMRDILVHYKEDKVVAEKARMIIRKLNKLVLTEEAKSDTITCECGFMFLGEELECCPICLSSKWNKALCFYKNESDDSCSLDGTECNYINRTECKKEV
jgi:hypothetical protein